MHEDLIGDILSDLGKGSLEKFQHLSPEGRDALLEIVRHSIQDKAAIEACYALDYDRIPPTIETFLDHSDYMGHFKDNLFPAWRPHIIRVCSPNSGIHEAAFTGAQGLGKTTAACLIVAYKMARMFCLKNPQRFYGLGLGSQIIFGFYAATKALIQDVGFLEFKALIDNSPFFRDVYPRAPHGKEYIEWPSKNIKVIVGSSELHAIGRNLFAVIADELNYMKSKGDGSVRARDLVREVSRRLEGRFLEVGGDIPGIAVFISQTRTINDFLEKRIRDSKGKEGVHVVRGPRWHFRTGGYHRDPKRGFKEGDPTFRVFTGSETQDPCVLDQVVVDDHGVTHVVPLENDFTAQYKNASLDRILHVPLVHYKAFCDDLYGSLRNIADVPTGGFVPFFPRVAAIAGMFRAGIVNPFQKQCIPCYEQQAMRLREYFDYEHATKIVMGRRQPIRHPAALRYVHFDLSEKKDHTGIAMVHASGHEVVQKTGSDLDIPSEVGESYVAKSIEVDFYIAISAGPLLEPIDYRKLRIFMAWLRSIGYPIAKITADRHQSADHLQRLREAGFETDYLSVDRKPSLAYKALRQLVNEGRIAVPQPACVVNGSGDLSTALLYNEFVGLEHDEKADKVDHRDTNPDGSPGSKDIADAVTGAVYSCLMDKTPPSSAAALAARMSMPIQEQRFNRYLKFVRPH